MKLGKTIDVSLLPNSGETFFGLEALSMRVEFC